jgi:hypothetical protein
MAGTTDTMKAILMLKMRDRRNSRNTPAVINTSTERLRLWRKWDKEMRAKCEAAKRLFNQLASQIRGRANLSQVQLQVIFVFVPGVGTSD